MGSGMIQYKTQKKIFDYMTLLMISMAKALVMSKHLADNLGVV